MTDFKTTPLVKCIHYRPDRYVDVDQDRMLEWGQRFGSDLLKTTENPSTPDTENPGT